MEEYFEDCKELIAKGIELYLSFNGRKVVRGTKRVRLERAMFLAILEADGEIGESADARERSEKVERLVGANASELRGDYINVPIEFSFMVLRESGVDVYDAGIWVVLYERCWSSDLLLHRTIKTGTRNRVAELLEYDGRKSINALVWLAVIGRYGDDPSILREFKSRFEIPRDKLAKCRIGGIPLSDMRNLYNELFS